MKKVFISYAHKDQELVESFLEHLSGLVRAKIIEPWSDRLILVGQEWDDQISQKINSSDFILFFLSSTFLSSEYINEKEIANAIRLHEDNQCLLIPIFLRPCDFESSLLSKFQGVPRDAKFITEHQNIDTAFLEVVKELKKSFEEFSPKQSTFQETQLAPCDTPPDSEIWVGRKKELSILNSSPFKVTFITGFGGQGKSSLAAKFLSDQNDMNTYDFWDWRDFKEEENRLFSKLMEIVKRFNPSIDLSLYSDPNEEDLIEIFFSSIEDRSILFVFDNIDSYIDYESFVPTKTLDLLIAKALSSNHKCQFVFTCRPFIKKADVGFFQLELKGLDKESSIDLLNSYGLSIKKERKEILFEELHSLTNGHPFWLHLLAAQAMKGINQVEEFITKIKEHTDFDETDVSSILSEKIIDEMWDSLNPKQKKLLRCLTELIKGETSDNIHKMVQNEFNWNQYSKSLKSLKHLNLVVTKTREDGEKEIELHPLVKSYVVKKYPRSERNKYITYIFNYYNKITYVLREQITGKHPLDFYENWSNQIELAVNKNDFTEALRGLNEISESIQIAGYQDEYLRICKILFGRMDFERHLKLGTPYFERELNIYISVLSNIGNFEIAEKTIERYGSSFSEKSNSYVNYCDSKCYLFWSKQEYSEAIFWGEKAEKLSKDGQLERSDHNLYLALRDSRVTENVSRSLEYFLYGMNLEEILSSNQNEDLSAHFYGNLGRCLHYLKRDEEAIICFKRSFLLCYKEEHANVLMNRGYASHWLAQSLNKLNEGTLSYFFYHNCHYYWSKYSPHRAKQVKEEISVLKNNFKNLTDLERVDHEQIESKCINYCKSINYQ
ncbi:MAG: TIR domain-containing protein [Oceanospirillaceae bacterium]|nr:TIR domain-containing protein [Oceanospirillaceae bacterium]